MDGDSLTDEDSVYVPPPSKKKRRPVQRSQEEEEDESSTVSQLLGALGKEMSPHEIVEDRLGRPCTNSIW